MNLKFVCLAKAQRKALALLWDSFKECLEKLYPELQLFTGWTHQTQNLEGQILKKVMLKGVDEDVVCFPIHDAGAVPKRHQL